jgi:DNA-binding transcriptional regulator YiaG
MPKRELTYAKKELSRTVKQRFGIPPGMDTEMVENQLRALPLHKRIETLRLWHTLSQQDLGDAIGMSRNSISNWEGQPDNPRRSVPNSRARALLGYAFNLPASVFAED